MKFNSQFILLLIFCGTIILPIVFPNIPIGNYIFICSLPFLLGLTFIFFWQSIKSTVFLFVGFLILTFVLFIFNTKYHFFYLAIDFIKFLIVVFMFRIIHENVMQLSFMYVSASIIFINIFFSFFSFFYTSEGRFLGILMNVNMSVYLVSFSIIYVFIFFKNKVKYRLLLFISFLLLFLYLFIVSQSRSFIFALLVFIYMGRDIIRLKYIVFSATIALILMINTNLINLDRFLANNRLSSKEPSYVTRSYVYQRLLSKIASSNGQPNGPYADQLFVNKITTKKGMHAHNDILKYIYDYSIFFIFFLIFFFSKTLSGNRIFILDRILLLIFYMSTSLHGYLFLFIFLLPYFLILSLINSGDLKVVSL